MLEKIPRPIIFAHRGASAHAPENTLAAFELAVQHRADAIELDVKLSADGVPVVIHDPTTDRTTGAPGRVADLPLAALRGLDAGRSFGEKFSGERIPTLDEVFESVGGKLPINVELTNYSTPTDDLVERVAAVVKKHNLQDRIVFSSFLPANLEIAARLLPNVRRGLLASYLWKGRAARRQGWQSDNYHSLNPFYLDALPGLVRRAHRQNKQVFVYTVNSPLVMRVLKAWGVDGIFTDDPALARRVYRREA
ncbi:MAG: glycerophosphodiester phosphodiesterase family protein [Chloroflexota bacterium]